MKDLFFIILTFMSIEVSAYGPAYIIIDKDGYTNIREEPSIQSKIIGQVQKYQVFFSIEVCEGEEEIKNWLRIISDITPDGYIYRKNILPINQLPVINGMYNLKTNTYVCSGNNLQVTMEMQIFDKNDYKTNIYDNDIIAIHTIDGQVCYGVDGWAPERTIKQMAINYKEKEIVLSKEIVGKYFDVNKIAVYIGLEDELYIHFSGGDGVAWYGVWFSIVNGNFVYNTIENLCG
jgi:hypothetical protein